MIFFIHKRGFDKDHPFLLGYGLTFHIIVYTNNHENGGIPYYFLCQRVKRIFSKTFSGQLATTHATGLASTLPVA